MPALSRCDDAYDVCGNVSIRIQRFFHMARAKLRAYEVVDIETTISSLVFGPQMDRLETRLTTDVVLLAAHWGFASSGILILRRSNQSRIGALR